MADSGFALMLVYAATGIPFSVFILAAFFHGLPRDLQEAARLDGAGEFRIFLRVMLPLVKPALATVAIFQLVQLWKRLLLPAQLLASARLRQARLIRRHPPSYSTKKSAYISL